MVQEPDEPDEPDDPTATGAPEIEPHEPVPPSEPAPPSEPVPPSEAPSPDESDTPPPRPVQAPRVDHRRFRRELTPTWLAAVAALHDGPCPRLHTHELRVAYLGVGHSVTAAVIAAVHPHASVWAWDHRPGPVELISALGEAADLENLTVHQHPVLPGRLGAPSAEGDSVEPVDLVVIDHVLDALNDDGRAHVLHAVEASLRPGGVVAVTYRTAIGWAEIAPIVRLLRYMVTHHGGPLLEATSDAVRQLVQLREAGAVYLNARPVVRAWLDELAASPAEQVVTDYLDQGLHPLSHAQLSDAMGAIGCHFVASATLDDVSVSTEDDDPLPDELLEVIAAASSVELRETYRDLAWRRTIRADVFRLGRHHSPARGQSLQFAPTAGGDDPMGDGDDKAAVLRAWRSGRIHPVATASPTDTAVQAAARLSQVLADQQPDSDVRLEVVAPLGTAVEVATAGSASTGGDATEGS